MKDIFGKEKIAYKNIEIPEELEFIVIKSIKEGKKRNNYNVRIVSKILVASLVAFFILLNVFPKLSASAQNIPIIGKIAYFFTIDKGFSNAVEEGLTQDIGYENEINGITLKVSNLVGDYKAMWVEYEVEEGYNVEVKLMDMKEEEEIKASNGQSTEAYGEEGNYIEIKFEKFQKEFLMVFNIYNKDNSEKLAVFKVPINLDDKFGENKSLEGKNIIKTDIGDIEVKGINTSKTRTSLSFVLNSAKYNFVDFENPVLIDSNGNEYKISSLYSIFDNDGNNNIEFEGEIKGNNIKFKADHIFYDEKYDKKIVVDLSKKIVEDNKYNISFDGYEDKILTLKAENVQDVQYKIEEDKYKFKEKETHSYEEGNKLIPIEVITSLEILQEDDGIIEINIDSITKDKVDGFEVKIN